MNRLKTADHSLMRELNTSIVMDSIRLFAPLSRADLAGRTGLTRSTVSLIVDELIDRGFVRETSTRQDPKIGRPGTLLQFNPEGGFAVGVELGVDFISVALTDFVGQVLWRRKQEIAENEAQIVFLEQAENGISEAVEYGKQLGLRPLGIGVGVPGLVDARQGKLIFAPNLRWGEMPLRLMWTRRFDLPVYVENEANAASLGERFYGVAHDAKEFIFLKTGVGLGGGIMIDGKLFRGVSGFAGEIGHMTLYPNGNQCGCGRKGCWETYVRPASLIQEVSTRLQMGEPSILPALVQGDQAKITLEVIAEAAQRGDRLTHNALESLAGHFTAGIANLVNIFNPELVVLGGTLHPVAPWLVPLIASSLQVNILPPLRSNTRIESSAQGEDACLLGAIALVLDEILREPLTAL